jgi:hypothetical protein
MELSVQDRVVMTVLNSMQAMGLTVVGKALELGTGAIHIRASRADGVKVLAIVDAQGRTFYDTWY